jgi:hypothetical protein
MANLPHRRDALVRLGQLGLGGLTLPQLLRATQGAQVVHQPRARARSCIFLFLWGGPSQPDMWDMKPEAPAGLRSIFQPVETATPGIWICDQMPRLAQRMDKVCLVRSMTHESNNHEPSVYHTLTGRTNPALVVPANARKRTDFPGLGSIVAMHTPPGNVPASVTIPQPVGHDGFNYAGTYGGFLGPRYDPVELRQVTPGSTQAAGDHATALPPGLDAARVVARKGLLRVIEEDQRAWEARSAFEPLEASRELAYRLISAPETKRAFDLEREDPRVRDRYGRNMYGESFLLARRLVEAGVRLVTVTWLYFVPSNLKILNVWDSHGGTADLGSISGFDMLKADYCIPPLDLAYSALLDDLESRGLLDETLVVAVGEFGRTPRINPAQGREHWGMCYSALLAGGGIRGGQVYGASDKQGAFPKENPVRPEDLLATIYHALGIDPSAEMRDPLNRPFRLSDGRVISDWFTARS